MRHSERLARIPPYLFAQLERKVAVTRVDVLREAAQRPRRELVLERQHAHRQEQRARVDAAHEAQPRHA